MREAQFDPKLESLRGLAALAVCFTHSIAVYRLDGSPAIWNVRIWDQSFGVACLTFANAVFNPNTAVILFFVLSGYVLTQSLRGRNARSDIPGFYVRRAFRILPMMWAAILIAYLASHLDHSGPPVSRFYDNTIDTHPTVAALIRNIVLASFDVAPVTWTMRVELLGSLFVPLLAIVANQRVLTRLIVLAGLVALSMKVSGDISYLVCFYVGALLVRPPAIPGLPAIALGLALSTMLRLLLFQVLHPALSVLFSTISASLILTGVIRATSRPLTLPPVRLVGRLSYSLYLLHLPILGLCAITAFAIGFNPDSSHIAETLALFMASTLASLAAAAITYRWIELPSIAIGKKIWRTRRLPDLTGHSSAKL